jgi:hypothetical protein
MKLCDRLCDGSVTRLFVVYPFGHPSFHQALP